MPADEEEVERQVWYLKQRVGQLEKNMEGIYDILRKNQEQLHNSLTAAMANGAKITQIQTSIADVIDLMQGFRVVSRLLLWLGGLAGALFAVHKLLSVMGYVQ